MDHKSPSKTTVKSSTVRATIPHVAYHWISTKATTKWKAINYPIVVFRTGTKTVIFLSPNHLCLPMQAFAILIFYFFLEFVGSICCHPFLFCNLTPRLIFYRLVHIFEFTKSSWPHLSTCSQGCTGLLEVALPSHRISCGIHL